MKSRLCVLILAVLATAASLPAAPQDPHFYDGAALRAAGQ